MSEQALVVGTGLVAVLLMVTSVLLIWQHRISWWAMMVIDTVALPLAWLIMASTRPVIGGNFAGIGFIVALFLTLPVALAVCLSTYGLRRAPRDRRPSGPSDESETRKPASS